MSKTTKIIAALGVVAGLGVAALPAFTFAAQVDGNVDIYVKVEPAIAMVITGNNDDPNEAGNAHLHQPTESGTDPHGVEQRTSGGTGTTMFGVQHNALVSSSKIAALYPGTYASTASNVTVYTNNPSGYTLSVGLPNYGEGATGALRTDDSTPATIAHNSTSFSETGGLGKWALKSNLSAESTEATTHNDITTGWTDVESAAKVLRHTDEPTSGTYPTQGSGSTTVVTYGVSAAADQATGVYKTTLKYTATTN